MRYQARLLEAAGWLGNIQYRPYSKSGPILGDNDDWRAVTLFELEDFRGYVERKEKHIVLIARQCGICGMTKAEALLPLLEPGFRLFSELVIDTVTAHGLLGLSERATTH